MRIKITSDSTCDLDAALLEKYPADEAETKADVANFLAKLKEADALV